MTVSAWSYTKTRSCNGQVCAASNKTDKCIRGTLLCDHIHGDFDLVDPASLAHKSNDQQFTDYDLEDEEGRQDFAPRRDDDDESMCDSLATIFSRESNNDSLFLLAALIIVAFVGLFGLLSVTFYLTVFNPRRDMILEEEFEFCVLTDAAQSQVATRLQDYLTACGFGDSSDFGSMLGSARSVTNEEDFSLKVTTNINMLPKLAPLESADTHIKMNENPRHVDDLPSLKATSVVRGPSAVRQVNQSSTRQMNQSRLPSVPNPSLPLLQQTEVPDGDAATTTTTTPATPPKKPKKKRAKPKPALINERAETETKAKKSVNFSRRASKETGIVLSDVGSIEKDSITP